MNKIAEMREGLKRANARPWTNDHLSRHFDTPRDQIWIDAEEASVAMNNLEALLLIAEKAVCPRCGGRKAGLCDHFFHKALAELS